MDDARQLGIDQRREHDGAHAVGFTLRVDTGDGFLRLFDIVEEGNPDLLEFDFLELRHQTVAEGFDGETGTIGDEECGAFDHHGHPVILTAVAQAGGNAVDRQVDAAGQSLVGIAAAVTLEQLDLQVVERVHVRGAQFQRLAEQGVVGQQFILFFNRQQVAAGQRPFGLNAAEYALAQLGIGNQFGVARGDGEVGLGQHHVHIGQQRAEEGPGFQHPA